MTMLPRFALNHMTAPRFEVGEFFRLARSLGLSEVEIRNDLSGNAILDGTAAATVRALADQAGVTIIAINALQRFNEWTAEREREATELADYAEVCGAKALVLVPVNDGSGRANGERQGNLRVALKALGPSCRRAASPDWLSLSASRFARCAPSRKRLKLFARWTLPRFSAWSTTRSTTIWQRSLRCFPR